MVERVSLLPGCSCKRRVVSCQLHAFMSFCFLLLPQTRLGKSIDYLMSTMSAPASSSSLTVDHTEMLAEIRGVTRATMLDVLHRFQKHCNSAPATKDCIIRCASLGSTLIRKARLLSERTTLPVPLDEVALWTAKAVTMISSGNTQLLSLLRAELVIVEHTTTERVASELLRLLYGTPNEWNVSAAAALVARLPSPIDVSDARGYCSAVEDNSDAGLVEDVSLVTIVGAVDPLSMSRIQMPARGTRCRHLQCFDARSFLSVLRRAALSFREGAPGGLFRKSQSLTAPCPVCSLPVQFSEWYVDRLQQAALQGAKGDPTKMLIDRRSGVITLTGSEETALLCEPIVPSSPQDTSKRKRPRDAAFTIEGVSVFDDRLS